MATTIAQLEARITADTSGFQSGMQEAHAGLKGFGGGIVGAAKGALDFGMKLGGSIFAVKSLADGAMGLGSALLGPVASMEQNQIAFTGLLGSGQKADAFLKDMASFAASTPFEFPELVTASQHMLAFGFNSKDIKPMLVSIGDAMAAMGQGGDSVDQVVRILGQMHAATKVNAGDMMQLTSMGIPAWQALAKGMGKTVPELQKMVSAGLVPADKAIGILKDSFDKSFGGSMQKQSLSFNGLMSTLADNARMALMAFAGPLFDRAKGALEALGTAVQSPAFQQFAGMLGGVVAQALDKVVGFVQNLLPSLASLGKTVQTQVLPFFSQIWTVISTQLLPAIGNLAGVVLTQFLPAVRNLWAVLAPQLLPALQAVGGVIQNVVGPALAGLLSAVSGVIDFIATHQEVLHALEITLGIIGAVILASMVPAFIGWAIAAGAAAIATIAATWPVLAVIAAIALLALGIGLLVSHWTEITTFLSDVWANVVAGVQLGLQILGQWFSDLGTKIHDALMAAIKAIIEWALGLILRFQQARDKANATIANLISSIVSFFASLPGKVWGIVSSFVGGIISRFLDLNRRAIALIVSLVLQGVAKFLELRQRAIDAVLGLVSGALSAIGGLKDKLVRLVSDAIGNMIGAIRNKAGEVAGAFGNLFSGIHIPGFAEGGVTGGGLVMVGESGPELVALPGGSRVYPHGSGPAGSSALVGMGGGRSSSGGGTISVTIPVYVAGRKVTEVILPDIVNEIRRATGGRA